MSVSFAMLFCFLKPGAMLFGFLQPQRLLCDFIMFLYLCDNLFCSLVMLYLWVARADWWCCCGRSGHQLTCALPQNKTAEIHNIFYAFYNGYITLYITYSSKRDRWAGHCTFKHGPLHWKLRCWSQKSRILGIFIVRAIRIYLTRVPFKCWQPFQISQLSMGGEISKIGATLSIQKSCLKGTWCLKNAETLAQYWLEYPLKWGLNWGVPLIWVWKKKYFLFFDHPFKLDSLCYLSPMMTHQEQMPKVMYTILLGGHK